MLIGNEIILSPFAYYRYYANGGDLQPEIDPIKWSGVGGKAYWQPNDWLMITSSVSANGVWDFDPYNDSMGGLNGLKDVDKIFFSLEYRELYSFI